MKAGDTFFLQDRRINDHLFVIVSDPDLDPNRIVLAYMTTHEPHKDNACLLEPGEHPRISHETCIAYGDARLASLDQLIKLRDTAGLIVQPPVSGEILIRIRAGVSRSREIKYKYVELLLEQGAIE